MPAHPTVMVVDDDELIIAAFEDFFRRERYTMVPARSANEALQKVEGIAIDLLITDIRLKEQSGVTLFMRMKENHPSVAVIVITGYPDAISEEELRTLGADAMLLKPLELDGLREAIRSALQHRAFKPDKPRYS